MCQHTVTLRLRLCMLGLVQGHPEVVEVVKVLGEQ